jgi:hypothetical protein
VLAEVPRGVFLVLYLQPLTRSGSYHVAQKPTLMDILEVNLTGMTCTYLAVTGASNGTKILSVVFSAESPVSIVTPFCTVYHSSPVSGYLQRPPCWS